MGAQTRGFRDRCIVHLVLRLKKKKSPYSHDAMRDELGTEGRRPGPPAGPGAHHGRARVQRRGSHFAKCHEEVSETMETQGDFGSGLSKSGPGKEGLGRDARVPGGSEGPPGRGGRTWGLERAQRLLWAGKGAGKQEAE